MQSTSPIQRIVLHARFIAHVATACWLLAGVHGNAWAEEFQAEIEAPAAVATLLKTHLEIVQRQSRPGMSLAEWQSLYRNAPAAIAGLLDTEGYFSPSITSSMQQEGDRWIARFKVEPGEPSRIGAVVIEFSGAITQQPHLSPSPSQLRADWLLPVGRVFRQQEWDDAKRALLQALVTERYPAAQIRHSRATMDPATRHGTLEVEIDSGPEFTFGAPQVEGLQRYPLDLVENLNPTRIGQPYSQAELLRYQQRLQETGDFKRATVDMDIDPAHPRQVPIRITLEEAPARKLGFGVGLSSDTGYRGQITYEERNLFGRGWQWLNALKLEQYAQSVSSEIRLPLDAKGNRDSIRASWEDSEIQDENTNTINVTAMRRWGTQHFEQFVSLDLFSERKEVDNELRNTSGTIAAGYGLTLRQLDNLLSPTRGYQLTARMAASPGVVVSEEPFVQGYTKLQGYLPLAKNTQLLLRGELGALNSSDPSIPNAYLFRTGGAQSVRGYDFESLGEQLGKATVGSRYLAVGSAEVVQWLTPKWGVAAFYDLGNAADTLKDLSPVAGYGLGARWKSPAGLVNVDVAYGEDKQQYRLHFSLGAVF